MQEKKRQQVQKWTKQHQTFPGREQQILSKQCDYILFVVFYKKYKCTCTKTTVPYLHISNRSKSLGTIAIGRSHGKIGFMNKTYWQAELIKAATAING